MLKAVSELGFTPVSRPRISMVANLPLVASDWGSDDHDADSKPSLMEFLAPHPDRQIKH
jgi:hypothetical protein